MLPFRAGQSEHSGSQAENLWGGRTVFYSSLFLFHIGFML